MLQQVLQVHEKILRNELYYNNVLMLTYTIRYPQFASRWFQSAVRRMNLTYRTKALAFKKHCETELYRLAVEQYQYAVQNNFPFMPYEAVMVYSVTYNQNCALSLYFDQYEFTGGAHGNTVRDSATWNLNQGRIMRLAEFFPANRNYRAYIINMVIEQISRDPTNYFEDYKNLVAQYFNPNSFFLTPEGIVVYFQQYEIAPYATGIPMFIIPYLAGNATEPRCRR